MSAAVPARWAAVLGRLFVFAAVLALPVAIGIDMMRTAVDIPFWDEWEWADMLYRLHSGTLAFATLWEPHNEHRMLLPQLLVAGLDLTGGWSQLREQLMSLVVLILTELGVVALVGRSTRGYAAGVAVVLCSAILFGRWQWENLSWGFQTAWFLCNAGAVAVAWLLTAPRRTGWNLTLSVVIAFAVTFCSSQGLAVWVVGLVALAIVPRAFASNAVVWVVSGAAAFALYSSPELHHAGGGLIHRALTAVPYILVFLGAPVGGADGVNASIDWGIAGLIILAALALTDLRSGARRLVRHAGWYALASYPLAAACATAYGRSGFGIDQALASRYTTTAGILWVCIVGLVCARISRLSLAAWEPRVVLFGLFALSLALRHNDAAGASYWALFTAKLDAARSGVIASRTSVLPLLYPDPTREALLWNDLRAIHDGPFWHD